MPCRRLPLLTALAVGVLAPLGLSGCGEAPSPPAASPPSASVAPPPATVTRTGGVAGMSDRLEVGSQGAVSGTLHGASVRCTLDPATLSAFHRALTTRLAAAPTPAPTRSGSDLLQVRVGTSGSEVDLGEGTGTDPLSRAVSGLFDDLARPPAERTHCR